MNFIRSSCAAAVASIENADFNANEDDGKVRALYDAAVAASEFPLSDDAIEMTFWEFEYRVADLDEKDKTPDAISALAAAHIKQFLAPIQPMLLKTSEDLGIPIERVTVQEVSYRNTAITIYLMAKEQEVMIVFEITTSFDEIYEPNHCYWAQCGHGNVDFEGKPHHYRMYAAPELMREAVRKAFAELP